MVHTNHITDLEFIEIPNRQPVQLQTTGKSSGKAFIEANTIEATLAEIRNKHIIPVFAKDNEPLISHVDFIEATAAVVSDIYHGETILQPSIRLSHPIKGRIPEAKYKKADELLDHERTIYYERLAFVIEVPSVFDDVAGNRLSLTIGGVKAYSLDNLHQKKGAMEHFKIFIGFKNLVCTNLCVSSDGYVGDLKVTNVEQLMNGIRKMIHGYDPLWHTCKLSQLTEYNLSEKQFAQLIGRCRMYNYLPARKQEAIPPMLFGDQQIGAVCRDYYKDESFCRNDDGSINLWRLYNLFTGANKSSYVDLFLDRSVNAYNLAQQIRMGLDNERPCWFLQ